MELKPKSLMILPAYIGRPFFRGPQFDMSHHHVPKWWTWFAKFSILIQET